MNRIFLGILLLFSSVSTLQALPVGKCSVGTVYTSNEGYLYLDFDNCDGDLGWKKKRFEFNMNQSKNLRVFDGNLGGDVMKSYATFPELLAFKQTAELAFTFNLKVLVEIPGKGSDKISFLSLAQRFQPGTPEWKPVNTPPGPTPK